MGKSRSHKRQMEHGKGHELTAAKAETILEHGEVRGHKLTPAQERFFGWVRGGKKPRKGGRRK